MLSAHIPPEPGRGIPAPVVLGASAKGAGRCDVEVPTPPQKSLSDERWPAWKLAVPDSPLTCTQLGEQAGHARGGANPRVIVTAALHEGNMKAKKEPVRSAHAAPDQARPHQGYSMQATQSASAWPLQDPTGEHTDKAQENGSFEHVVLSTTCQSFPVSDAACVCSDSNAKSIKSQFIAGRRRFKKSAHC